MLARLISGAAGAFALAAFSFPAAGAQTLDPEALLPGWWGWERHADDPEDMPESCATKPMQIWFSEDGQRYNSRWMDTGGVEEPVASAPILQRLPSTPSSAGFFIQYDDEDRLDDHGQPVAWVLYMTGPDSFVWIRRDWIGTGNSTHTMVRCHGQAVS